MLKSAPYTYVLTSIIALVCVSFTGAVAADLHANNCQPTSRAKVFPDPKNPGLTYNVTHHEGWVGSIMYNFRLTLIEDLYADCRISTHYTLDYDIYNKTQATNSGGGSVFYITLLGAQGQVILKYPYVQDQLVQRGFCRYGHVAWQNGRIGANYFDITYGYQSRC